MEATSVIEDSLPEKHELQSADIQWNRIVELELVPHPNQERPKIIESDYGMTDGVLHVQVRAATVGYFLLQWIVDCSPKHSLKGHEYRLWLRNYLALYGVSNAFMAPGYENPR
jgi:hypothetical protein